MRRKIEPPTLYRSHRRNLAFDADGTRSARSHTFAVEPFGVAVVRRNACFAQDAAQIIARCARNNLIFKVNIRHLYRFLTTICRNKPNFYICSLTLREGICLLISQNGRILLPKLSGFVFYIFCFFYKKKNYNFVRKNEK